MKLLDLYRFDEHTDRVLVTCALPYVNNVPHLGNMVPIISADVYSRYLKMRKIPSIYICATDEHGTRTEIEAARAGLDEETYCKGLHDRMLGIFEWFNVDFTHFGRTSGEDNHRLTQEIFKKADAGGYVLDQETVQLYDEVEGVFLPDTFVRGTCPNCGYVKAKGDQCDQCQRLLDPMELIEPRSVLSGSTPVKRNSRHLFLRLDALAPHIKAWIEGQDHWEGIIRNMPLGWIQEGMLPRAITRDLKWGVQVPREGFEDKVFYVWFDAPIGYIGATAEWARQTGESLEDWWKGGKARLVHFLGKDNVPFHTLMWPGALLAADDGWNLPWYIASNEYLNYEGGKFSKTDDVGVFSDDVVGLGFPADAWRFFIISNRPEKRDTDFSFKELQSVINTSLVGNIGNLVNRAFSFMHKRYGAIPEPGELGEAEAEVLKAVEVKARAIDKAYARFELRKVASLLLELSDIGNKYFQQSEPWRTFTEDEPQCRTSLFVEATLVHRLLGLVWPIMPERAEAALDWIGCALGDDLAVGTPTKKPKYLFSKVEDETIAELCERFAGAGEEALEPLEFTREAGVDWPCVILELTGLSIKRRSGGLERWKEASIAEMDLDAIGALPHVRAYDAILEGRDIGGRETSVRNLIKIVRRQGKLPNINTLVDVYNTYSLKEGVVMGAYERQTIGGRLIYAVADGSERFIPVKGKAAEPIAPGEWVLRDDKKMVVTKVTTKQSEAAAVTPSTKGCAMCIQGNEHIGAERLQEIATEMAEKIVEVCGGQWRVVFAG